eukprot:jgi/Botrbrau1/16799/Bobra.150_2s0028.1
MQHLGTPYKSTTGGLHHARRGLAARAIYTQERLHRGQKHPVVVVSSRTVSRATEMRVTKLRELALRAVLMKDCDGAIKILLELMEELSEDPLSEAQTRPGPPQLGGHHSFQDSALHFTDAARERLGLVMRGQHENVMRVCLAAGRLDLGLQYWSLLPAKPVFFSTMLRLTLLYGTAEDVQEVVQARCIRTGQPPDAYSCSALVTAFGRSGDQQGVRNILEAAVVTGVANTVVYNAAIDALRRCGKLEAALELFKQMEGTGMKPTVATYNAVLRAAARLPGGGQQMKALYADMATRGLSPDSYTCSSIFLAAAEAGLRDGTWLLQVYSEVEKLGLLQHSRSLSAFLQACWGADLTEAQVQRVFLAVYSFRKTRRPDGSVYAALLTFCTRHAVPERAMDVFAALQEDKAAGR